MFASKPIGGRPVKWVEGRRESYQAHDPRPRPHHVRGGRREQARARSQGLRVKTYANLGGRLSTIGPGIPTTLYGRILAGPYKLPNVYAEVTGVYTNTTFVDAYRGAGRPEATYVVERAMDLVADELGSTRPRSAGGTSCRPTASRTTTRRGCSRRSTAPRSTSTPATTSRRWTRRSRWRATPTSRRRRPRRRLAASSSASASRPTSRCAASRPRSGSARSARAGAPRCGSRPTSRST